MNHTEHQQDQKYSTGDERERGEVCVNAALSASGQSSFHEEQAALTTEGSDLL